MSITKPPWKYPSDDITAVTLLLADSRISRGYVEVEETEGKPVRNAHCTWHLAVQGYTEEEVEALVLHFKQFGGKRGADREFTFLCDNCRLAWLDDGPCSDECTGRLPDFYKFDEVKREVIHDKRIAQQDAARERGLPDPFK